MDMNKQLAELKSFKMIPSNKIKTKLDFYYAPYSPIYNINKGMRFESQRESHDWNQMKDIVLKSDADVFSTILRQLKMQNTDNKEFMMKYKLLQRHPSIIMKNPRHQQQQLQDPSKAQTRSASANNSQERAKNQGNSEINLREVIAAGEDMMKKQGNKDVLSKRKRIKDIGITESIYIEDKGQNILMERSLGASPIKHDKQKSKTYRLRDSSNSPIMNQTSSDFSMLQFNGNHSQRNASQVRMQSRLRQLLIEKKNENKQVEKLDRSQILKQIELIQALKQQRLTQQQKQKPNNPTSQIIRTSRNNPERLILKSNSLYHLKRDPSSKEDMADTSLSKSTLMINLRFPKINKVDEDLDTDVPRQPIFRGHKNQTPTLTLKQGEGILEESGQSAQKSQRIFNKTGNLQKSQYQKGSMSKTQDKFLDKLQKDDQNLNDIINKVLQTTQLPTVEKKKNQLSDFVIFNESKKSHPHIKTSKLRSMSPGQQLDFSSNQSKKGQQSSNGMPANIKTPDLTPIFKDSIITFPS